MSISSPTDLLAAGGLGSSGLSPISPSDLPASVRNGSPAEKQAYTEALEFEQVLVNELAQKLSATVTSEGSGSDDGSDDGSDGSDGAGGAGSSTGLLGSDSTTSLYASLIPQAMTDSIMADGGLGSTLTTQLADSIDPQLATDR